MKKREFDFSSTLNYANKIKSIDERILFLKKEIKEYKQMQSKWEFDMVGYLDKVNKEIKYLSELNKGNKNTIHVNHIRPKPIWWQKSDRLLGYLIKELARLGYIDRGTDINEVIEDHFINRDKNPFTDSIKQNRSGTGINKNSKPKGSIDIDNIISNLR